MTFSVSRELLFVFSILFYHQPRTLWHV